jgi:hypothetical protein
VQRKACKNSGNFSQDQKADKHVTFLANKFW